MFCIAVENDQNLRQERDLSFIDELMRTKNVLKVLRQKITEGASDVDVIEYATAVTMLEYKLSVLSSLNISVENDTDDSVSFNIFGSNKSITINKAKLREAITITDSPVVEKQGTAHQSMGKDLPSI
jgi:1,4-alpha-glucan branching enzyme